MVNEIFTGKSESVEVNKKGDFEIIKKKSDKKKQESFSKIAYREILEAL